MVEGGIKEGKWMIMFQRIDGARKVNESDHARSNVCFVFG